MPISDDLLEKMNQQWSEFAERLLDDINFLRQENSVLTKMLLDQRGLLAREELASEPLQSLGKEPWHLKQARLERLFSATKVSVPAETQETKETQQ